MKRMALLLITCLVITGCSQMEKQETFEEMETALASKENEVKGMEKSDEIETVEEIPLLKDLKVTQAGVSNNQAIEPVKITIEALESNYNNNNGVLVSQVKIEYPIIKNDLNQEGIAKINDFFQETAQALFEENDTYASDNAEMVNEESYTDIDYKDAYSKYLVTFEVKYNANGLLSILQNFSEHYYGKEDVNSYSTGYVFDVDTGNRLAISDILIGTDEEIANLIGQTFMHCDAIAESIRNCYKEDLLANIQYVEFYIDTNNICFFYNPNMVVPYSKGIIKAYIPFNTKDIFKIELKEID